MSRGKQLTVFKIQNKPSRNFTPFGKKKHKEKKSFPKGKFFKECSILDHVLLIEEKFRQIKDCPLWPCSLAKKGENSARVPEKNGSL
jgi:hypothetical protein